MTAASEGASRPSVTPCRVLSMHSPYNELPTIVRVAHADTGEEYLYLADDRELTALSRAMFSDKAAPLGYLVRTDCLIPDSALRMLRAGFGKAEWAALVSADWDVTYGQEG